MYVLTLTTDEDAILAPWLRARAFYAGLSINYRPVYHVSPDTMQPLFDHARAILPHDQTFTGYMQEAFDRQSRASL